MDGIQLSGMGKSERNVILPHVVVIHSAGFCKRLETKALNLMVEMTDDLFFQQYITQTVLFCFFYSKVWHLLLYTYTHTKVIKTTMSKH